MIELRKGDIFMTDNFSTASKIVKFLMQEKTLWHHLFKLIFRIPLNEVRFYHVGMILDQETMIEQQGKVKLNPTEKIFRKNYIIWRKKDLIEYEAEALEVIAQNDLNEGYGILECIGKTISWLTGIKYFAKWFDMKDNAICAIRVAEWYKEAIGETFGEDDPNYLTTDKMDNYMIEHFNEWEEAAINYE